MKKYIFAFIAFLTIFGLNSCKQNQTSDAAETSVDTTSTRIDSTSTIVDSTETQLDTLK